MKIDKNTAVTLLMKIVDTQGQVIDAGKKPVVYLHGGYEQLPIKVEAALDGQEPGFETALALPAADAFGERDEALVRTIAKSDFPPGVKVGGQLEMRGDDGAFTVFSVTKIKGPQVLLDGNHPLAGRDLRFDISVVDVRAASAEEVAHQHVHGEHGHQH